jgi:putative multiple sugar transport system substrate-binding protein
MGVSVIAYDRLIMNTPNVDYYATFDNFKVGVIQGQYIESRLGLKAGKGPYNIELFAGSPDDNNALFFFNGAMSILQPYIDSGKLVIPSGQKNFTTIAIQSWDSGRAQARMDNLITANYAKGKKLDVILSPNDSLAIGIVASLKNNGYGTAAKPYPVLTGQDCDKANVKAIINGQQSMSVFKDTRDLAAQVVEMVDAIMSGKTVPVNDTKTYNNGVKVVPSYLCTPVFVDKNNTNNFSSERILQRIGHSVSEKRLMLDRERSALEKNSRADHNYSSHLLRMRKFWRVEVWKTS